MASATPRSTLLLGLLATLPALAFVVMRGETIAAIAILSVLVIIGSLYRALEPPQPRGATSTA